MALFDQLFTNLFWDGEVSGVNPDVRTDYYQVTDFGTDHRCLDGRIADMLRSLSQDSSKEFFILFGGEVTDGGSGTVNISECVAVGKDANGNRNIIHLPALTGVSLPTGYNDNRQIWVKLKCDIKLGSSIRVHYCNIPYHYQLLNTYLGNPLGSDYTGATDLFTDSDPGDTVVILGSFQMSAGNVFTDLSANERTRMFALSPSSQTNTSNVTMYPNKKYFANGTSRITYTLPASSSVGDTIEITDVSGYGWKVAQNAGQNIIIFHQSSIPGTAGYVHSRTAYASVKLVCTVANTTWETVKLNDQWIMEGFHIGGGRTSTTVKIEKINFDNESVVVDSAILNEETIAGGSLSSQTKGYFLGGISGGAYRSTVKSYNFSTGTYSLISGVVLSVATAYPSNFETSSYGYTLGGIFSGGGSSYISAINKTNFTDDATGSIATVLVNARGFSGSAKSNIRGYAINGLYNGTGRQDVERFIFSDESISTIITGMNPSFSECGNVSSKLKGYILGGTSFNGSSFTSYTSAIRSLAFSTESFDTLSETLNVGRTRMTSINNGLLGYVMGGISGSSTYSNNIDDLNFNNETSKLIYSGLSESKSTGVGVQGFIG